MAGPMMDYVITAHAAFEMQRRGVAEADLEQVLRAPEQRFPVRAGREVFQSRMRISGTEYLVRVFVDVERQPVEVVTVYRTSKVSKYWRDAP